MSIEKHSRPGEYYIKHYPNGPQDIIYIPEPLRGWLETNVNTSGLIWEGRCLMAVLIEAGAAAGIKITSHTFRHASATYLYESTNDFYQDQAH